MGSPGAGKSTLSELLAERLRMIEVRSGEILRNLVADRTADSELVRAVGTHLRAGRPMPVEVYAAAVQRYLRSTADYTSTGVIFEGFPRTVDQCTSLPRTLTAIGLPSARIVGLHLTASTAECAARIRSRVTCQNCGRVISASRTCCADPAPGKRDDDLNPHARLEDAAPLARRVAGHFERTWPVIMMSAGSSPGTIAGEAINQLRELGLRGCRDQRPSDVVT